MKKEKGNAQTGEQAILSGTQSKADRVSPFAVDRKDIKELIAPEGINTDSLNYTVVYDTGREQYVCVLYIHKFPKRTNFVNTYVNLVNFPGVTTNFFISPLEASKAKTMADKRVRQLSVEMADSEHDEVRYATLRQKHHEATEWMLKVESGAVKLFNSQFTFAITGDTEENMRRNVDSFVNFAKAQGIELVGCYGAQAEAFRSVYPFNRPGYLSNKMKSFIKTQYMDDAAIGDIFNHTSAHFIHPKGVVAGHYLDNNQVMTWDPYDSSHDNMGCIFTGPSGVGKSATIKMLMSRMIDFGTRVRVLDVDSPTRRGEYVNACLAAGGIHFEISSETKNILNPYEISTCIEYDEDTCTEWVNLPLKDRLTFLRSIYQMVINEGKSVLSKATDAAMTRIMEDINAGLYAERGIVDGVPDSLYELDSESFLGNAKKKKTLPTISDAYKKLLLGRMKNKNELYTEAYQILIDKLSILVKGVYYSEKTCSFFTKEEFDNLPVSADGSKIYTGPAGEENVIAVQGSRPYFDGQSTFTPNYHTPFVDYDIAKLKGVDKEFGMVVCLGAIEEFDVKTNSANPAKAEKMIVLMDELHNVFPYEEARNIIKSFYRQARKRYVSPWTATQSLADYAVSPDMIAVLKNSASTFVFRHSDYDRKFIKENMPDLTEAQIDKIFNLGIDPKKVEITEEERNKHRGEVCLIDAKRVAFIKMDYLVNTEAEYVETNVAKLKEIQKAKRGRQYQ